MLTENELKMLYEILRKLEKQNVLHKVIYLIKQLIEDDKNMTSKSGGNGGMEKEFKQLTVDELKLLDKFIENKLSDEDEDYNEVEDLQVKIKKIYQQISINEFKENKDKQLVNSNQKLNEELCKDTGIEKKGIAKGL